LAIDLGNKTLAMFSIAVATYLSFYPAMLAIPVVLMLIRDIKDSSLAKVRGSSCQSNADPLDVDIIS
jgi:hypothetical protein